MQPVRSAAAASGRSRRGYWWRIVSLLVTGLLAYWMLDVSGLMAFFSGSDEILRNSLEAFGAAGPGLLILLMVIAVVLSPLPSAPIALASGALYGHGWGTLYVLIGAEIGALLAFAIARYLRPPRLAEWLDGWLDERLNFRTFDSQHTLMLAVCTSRLLPFISFDLASYAAGLTPITTWRFAVATLIGILPASFLLAHLGGEMGSLEAERIALSLVLLAVLAGGGLLLGRWRRER